MRLQLLTAFVFLVAISLTIAACSLFQPAAVAPVPPPGPTPAQIVQKTIACVQSSVMPCLTQPPPMNNPQMCMALAGAQCVAVN
jgi:hypothetical protein